MLKTALTMPPARERELVRGLTKKTQAGQVNWIRKPPTGDARETVYELVLPQARLVVTHAVPRARPDLVSIRLSSLDGTSVDEWVVEEPDYDPDMEHLEQADPSGDWQLLRDFFAEVHRHATGYDRVIKSIEDALASPGVIGSNPPKVPSGSGTAVSIATAKGVAFSPPVVDKP